MDDITMIAEGLKALNNAAVDLITKGEYDGAEKMFGTIESTYRMIGYGEGISLVRTSMANLSAIRGDLIGSLSHLEIATENAGDNIGTVNEMRRKISLAALEIGIGKENDGDLVGALELFTKILPNLNEKRAEAVAAEIENIKRHLTEEGT